MELWDAYDTNLNKIKDKNLSNEIHKIMTTPHKPRRISKSLFIDYCIFAGGE